MGVSGLQGHYTNHSLRATAATRLFKAEVDEQLMSEPHRGNDLTLASVTVSEPHRGHHTAPAQP